MKKTMTTIALAAVALVGTAVASHSAEAGTRHRAVARTITRQVANLRTQLSGLVQSALGNWRSRCTGLRVSRSTCDRLLTIVRSSFQRLPSNVLQRLVPPKRAAQVKPSVLNPAGAWGPSDSRMTRTIRIK